MTDQYIRPAKTCQYIGGKKICDRKPEYRVFFKRRQVGVACSGCVEAMGKLSNATEYSFNKIERKAVF